MMDQTYHLIGPNGRSYPSPVKGTLGGNTDGIYGHLDCPVALAALRRNPARYAAKRVFFADEATAIAAGYRPCGCCMREAYRAWRDGRGAGV
ncbi:MAG TPA: Ada metal-binding domain-containing protein [Microvirga sp.]